MTFLAPGLLWGLAVLGPLIAIYFLRVRPRRRPTNAFFLWQQVFDRKKSSALFRRLRDVLSLLILALVAIGVVLAMARPKMEQEDERDILILIDNSASMLGKDGKKARIEEAKEEARKLVEALNGSRRAAIGTVSDRLRFITHFTDSPKDLYGALREVEAQPIPMSEEAVRELGTLAGDSGEHRVLLLTDAVNGAEGYGEGVEVKKIGAETGNVGLVAADMRWRLGRKGRASFFYKVASSFKTEKRCELILKHLDSGRIKKLIPLTLTDKEVVGDTVEIENAGDGRWEARLDVVDALEHDNVVPMALNPLRPVRVEVSAANPYFYRHCITSFESSGLIALVDGDSDARVVEGGTAEGDRLLIFKPDGQTPWWKSLGDPVEVLAPKARLKEHPLLRHIDLESMSFGGARKIEVPDDALVIAESDQGDPLIYQVTRDGRAVVVVNADPHVDDLILSPWFPVLIYDSARHLMGRHQQHRSVYPTGQKIADLKEVTRVGEKGEREEVTITDGVLTEAGHYEVMQGGVPQLFGASLLAADESRGYRLDVEDNAGSVPTGRPLAIWLLLGAMLLTCSESMLYHRRKVG